MIRGRSKVGKLRSTRNLQIQATTYTIRRDVTALLILTLILIFRDSDPAARTTLKSALRPVISSQEKRSASAAHSFAVASTLKNLDES